MAKYISGVNRNQMVLFPEKIDDLIAVESEVRIIDKFVDTLDLSEMGFKRAIPNQKGTNSFDPRDILKLYLYGYRNKIRSSRKLERLCETNIEVMWLIRGLRPDFRTISDFRKENARLLKKVFEETVIISKELKLLGNDNSQDGYKVKAVNSKERNYTLNKLDERIKREKEKLIRELSENNKDREQRRKEIEAEVEKYLQEMEEEDKKESGQETVQFTEEMVDIAKKVVEHRKIKREIERTGESQKSLTDEDARLMKNNGKYDTCYNVQEMTNVKSQIVVGYKADNNPADSGELEEMSEYAKKITGKRIINNITDKGYNDRKDMARCLEKGIRPHVTLPEKEEKSYEVEFEYVENEIKESEKKSRSARKIKKCLEAGVIPEVYKEILKDIRVEEKKIVEEIEEIEAEEKIGKEELRKIAMEKECFVKDKEEEKVYCPQGEVLRRKSKNREKIKYCNKLACERCKKPCTKAKFKELVMEASQIVSTQGNSKEKRELKEKYNNKKEKKKKIKKVVKAKLVPQKKKLKKRMGTSEHVHGTIKRTDDGSYLLLKGKEKVNGELALSYCAVNLRRLYNIVPFKEMMKYLEGKCREKSAVLR